MLGEGPVDLRDADFHARGWDVVRTAAVAVATLTAVVSPIGAAQAPTLPVFEVASVKPTKTTGVSLVQLLPGGRLRATNFSLQGLITRAWRLQQDQVYGGPHWIRSEGYDIEAKADGDSPADQVWLMLRALLSERFKLSIQMETRVLPVYELTMAHKDGRPGPSLRPFAESNCTRVAPGGPIVPVNADRPACGVLHSPVGHWVGRETTMDSLASTLTRVMGRVVLNRTGLAGTFDLDLQWTDLAQLLQPDLIAPPQADGPSLVTALQEQLGLRLDSRKGQVEVLVVKQAERPIPD
jgi:uncharacterized protein (TIGR03435 family)